MGQLNIDPLDRLFSSVGLPGSSHSSLPTVNASNNFILSSREYTYSITPPPASSSNPLDHILSPLIPLSTSKHAGSTSVSNTIPLPSTFTSSLCISTSASYRNTALDQPLYDAAWAKLWAPLKLTPSTTYQELSSASRVNDNDLFRPEVSMCSRVRFPGNHDINPQTFHHPSASSTRTSAASTQPPSSRPLPKAKVFLTTIVHSGLRAHSNTLFPSAFQSIGLTTKTITQIAQTVTQTVTATVTTTATVTSTATVTAVPTAIDVIMADAPKFVNAAADFSVFKTTAIDLIGRLLEHAAAVDGSFLQTAATKIINAAPPVLPLSSGIKLMCFLTSFLVGAGALQTAQYLRQRRHPAPISAEQRIARRWGFLWRREVEKDIALQGIVSDQAAQLLELDIQDALNAQFAHDVSDTTEEFTSPQDIQAFTPIIQRYAQDITAKVIPSQNTDAFTPTTRRYAQDVLPSAIRVPSSPSSQGTPPMASRWMVLPVEEMVENIPTNMSPPIHGEFAARDAFMREQTYNSGARSNMSIVEDSLKKCLTKAKAWEESDPAATRLRRKRSSNDAENDSYESRNADVHPDTPVPTGETPESGDMDDTTASSSQNNPVLDLENKPALRFPKRLRASSEVSNAAPMTPVAQTTRSKSPRTVRGNSTALEPGTVRRSSRIRSSSPKK